MHYLNRFVLERMGICGSEMRLTVKVIETDASEALLSSVTAIRVTLDIGTGSALVVNVGLGGPLLQVVDDVDGDVGALHNDGVVLDDDVSQQVQSKIALKGSRSNRKVIEWFWRSSCSLRYYRGCFY
jgi:hypothetical protein